MNFLESDIKIRKIVDKITKYNTRNWLKATSTQRELWHGIINMWLEEIKKLEKEIVEEKKTLSDKIVDRENSFYTPYYWASDVKEAIKGIIDDITNLHIGLTEKERDCIKGIIINRVGERLT